ncbi:restriction endonuclease [Devosia sp. 2618]|uniref:restriction endonuclease n=1 Tax=Devosia sp. 2618 TaxID=3156454 RepID=UPI00339A8B49
MAFYINSLWAKNRTYQPDSQMRFPMPSTTTSGNHFRDVVRGLLEAAGFINITVEKPLPGKNVDIYAERRGLVPEKYAFETKAYEATLSNSIANEFISHYGALLVTQQIHKAVLVSKGAISPSAYSALRSHQTSGMTFDEFQRHMFGAPEYLSDLEQIYEADDARSLYIPARVEGELLEDAVNAWLHESHNRPLVVLGGYGSGKTTFASHLTGVMAKAAISNPHVRIPVRIRLGDLTEQNNLEGLFGAHFTAAHTIHGYSWPLFRKLNSLGRFLIIFDGFDEMKHGMTIGMFQKQFDRLLQLAEGKAKVLVLGRDTAFLDEAEFKSVVKGRSFTANGTEVLSLSRPECDHVKLLPFTKQEAHKFIAGYFRHLLMKDGKDFDGWAEVRLGQLLSPRFDLLIQKPVHSQMLCRIATRPNWDIAGLDHFSLYDLFVEYLLMREVDKEGRFAGFGVPVRRTANSSLSWWLFSQDAASTMSLASAPVGLFKKAVSAVPHDFDDEALVRELAQGCLVEKGADVVYFGHRSIQEFLAAEHLYQARLTPHQDHGSSVQNVCKWATEQVCGFLEEFFTKRPDARDVADAALETFFGYVGPVDLDRLTPFEIALRHSSMAKSHLAGASGVWLGWLSQGKLSDAFLSEERSSSLLKRIYHSSGNDEYAAGLHLLYCAVLAGGPMQTGSAVAPLIASLINVQELSGLVRGSRGKRNLTISSSEHLKSFALARATSLHKHKVSGELMVELDIDAANQVARKVLGYLPIRSSALESLTFGTPLLSAPVQTVMRSLRDQRGENSLGGGKDELVRQFFSEEVREKVSAVEVAKSSRAVQVPRRQRGS